MQSSGTDVGSYLHLPEGYILGHGSISYEITGFLGSGGFGITYLGRDLRLDRRVALKEYFPREFAGRSTTRTVIPASVHEEETFAWGKARFLDEARLLAHFDHPNIVRVLDYFESNNTAYMVMQYVEGETLDQRLKRVAFSEAEARSLLAALVAALGMVHAAGVLHRDVKPSNVVLARATGQPVLIDFGSARQELGQHSKSLTAIASPGFSPKEQYIGSEAQTPATDIYALGATIYRAMFRSGPPPSLSRDEDERLVELDRAEAEAAVSKTFSAALRKCLAYRARDRYQTLAALTGALDATPADPHPAPARATFSRPPALNAAHVQLVKKWVAATDFRRSVGSWRLKDRLRSAVGKFNSVHLAAALFVSAAGAWFFAIAYNGEKTPETPEVSNKTLADAALVAITRELQVLRACKGGNAESCRELGVMYEYGEIGGRRDAAKAVEFYRKACDGGDPQGCGSLGWHYWKGKGGLARDLFRAATLIRKACEGGDANNCNNLAIMYENGQVGGASGPNKVKAAEFFRKACDGGDPNGCANLGYYYLRAEGGLVVDLARAETLLRQGCEGGAANGCNNLGVMYEAGQVGGRPDKNKAVEFYRKACDGGVSVGCKNLQGLNR